MTCQIFVEQFFEDCYGKRGRDSLLMERNDIIAWRRRYLRQIKALREKNVNLIYRDESCTNIGASVKREWKDTTMRNPRDAFVKGLITGLNAPTQRGPRFVLLPAGTEEGFVDVNFPGLKGGGIYHDGMVRAFANSKLAERQRKCCCFGQYVLSLT
ncbi:hypothetical protein JTB14_015602 [Gonioctena quinquepunctata]|nr:hypothetical protein JTB14_015602 [Gonioctena quinquepunctata]